MNGSRDPPKIGPFTADAFKAIAPTSIYQYRPLDDPSNEIRLLKYKGTSQLLASASLCFEFITVRCPSGPDDIGAPFYAVSYSWGTVPEVAEIILDGHEAEVPHSSEAALRGLITAFERGAGDANVPIWIDAICINQQDVAEKEKQLSLMARLYSCAQAVCIWLGSAGIHTAAALHSLNALKTEKEAWFLQHGEMATPPNGDLPTPTGCDWEALRTILAVPWFTRVWTIQEIVLARPGQANVFCGRHTFSWDDFAAVAYWAWNTHRDVMPDAFNAKYLLPAVMMAKVKMRGRVQLSRLLVSTISRGVTKQEDRIYGLLGIRPEEEAVRGFIAQSYDKPLSARYTAAAAMIMESENSLLLLEQMSVMNRVGYSTGPDGKEHWPTWVPRLDMENMSWGDAGLLTPVTGIGCNTHNGLPAPMIRSTPSAGLLHLRGLRIGTVELAFEPLIQNKLLTTRVESNNWDSTEVARHFSYLWAPEFIDEHSSRETIVAVADSLTIGGYSDIDDDNTKLIRDFGAMMYKGWELHSEQDRENFVLPAFAQEGNTGSIVDFVENVAGRAPRFRHLKISEGRFGMGYDNILPGDVVVILLGVNVPVILRPKGDRFALLGAIYVSGVMHGEYIRSLSEDQLLAKTETFDIC